ncbi:MULTISPECIES: DNA integrity scanning diadenylate cyclase DisA [Gordonia]|uniref:DNA integrity scanning protein DisA n=1 Tax=Gordonia sputi NBRC 100414 TaxID=1089453 RepID=H5TYZ9_9ACTN|nr:MULTISPECIES: DNA integrity scanning diadenylate cyclase DisA [Gordonia]NKY92304.1 DNA integrity scanning protein DisA [Gordonia sputi]OBA30774.1 DNA integrity scanning protein DisA [Gordonia sp. 852002-51296_SCH5728562-b]GAB38707.1 DNA integrity scanning protein DisA [Gordonia sputi NBRC 100414]
MSDTARTEPGTRSELMRETLARVAPGTGLRDGLERILRGGTGALIVIGHDSDVEKICDGGFHLDVEFAPTRLRELAKMDGAVVLSTDGKRIVRANVQLVPDPSIPTEESGTRHRSAERTAIQTGHPVISVSASMSIVSVYVDGLRKVVESPDPILSRANVALSTLERYKARLDDVSAALSRAEIEDYVLLRDAMSTAQRMEMVRRVSAEIDDYVLELGVNGRQVSLQLEELIAENDTMRELLVRDYYASPEPATTEEVRGCIEAIEALSDADLLDLSLLAGAFGYPTTIEAQDTAMSPRGYRLLAGISRLQFAHIDRLVRSFGTLQALLASSAADLQAIEGIGGIWARHIREGLSRLAETSIERFD